MQKLKGNAKSNLLSNVITKVSFAMITSEPLVLRLELATKKLGMLVLELGSTCSHLTLKIGTICILLAFVCVQVVLSFRVEMMPPARTAEML